MTMLHGSARAALVLMMFCIGGCYEREEIASGQSELGAVQQPAYVLLSKIWPSASIPVCWENPADSNVLEREWVRSAVEQSWSAVSAVRLTGWGICPWFSRGIRIRISDEGPHTTGLGTMLDGVGAGMVLNFTFNNWGQSCQSSREYCIRVIAVHEFGHALGLAHEQNRPDTPGWCDQEQGSNGDSMIGAWDLDSVMNYCNPAWSGHGQLSQTDILAIQSLYGTDVSGYTTRWGSNNMGQGATELAWLTGDVDGDGRTEIIQPWNNNGWLGLIVYRWNGSGYVASWGSGNMGQGATALAWLTGDVDGDGRTEIIQPWNNNGALGLIVYRWNGSGYVVSWGSSNMGQGAGALAWKILDASGDGRAELLQVWDNGGSLGMTLYRWTDSRFLTAWRSATLGAGSSALAWLTGDTDGDGRAEIIQPWNNHGWLGMLVYGYVP